MLAEAIMQELLEALEEPLDVCVASASVGPAPAGENNCVGHSPTWKPACHAM